MEEKWTLLNFIPKLTALVFIDLQQGIGLLERKAAPHPIGEVVRQCSELADRFRKAGTTIVYVRVNPADMVKLITDAPSRALSSAISTTHELLPEAGKQPADVLITKRHWSAFLNTDLEKELRTRGVQTIVIGGVATNFGVESTARDAAGLGFNIIFVEDAMTSISVETHQFAVNIVFPRIGRVRKAAEVDVCYD